MSVTRLHPDDLAALARQVADELAQRMAAEFDSRLRGCAPARWLDASEVANMLGISRDAVYRRADELGVRRIGSGPKARLRFNAATVGETLSTCSESRESLSQDRPPHRRSRPRLVAADGQQFPLLPVRRVE